MYSLERISTRTLSNDKIEVPTDVESVQNNVEFVGEKNLEVMQKESTE